MAHWQETLTRLASQIEGGVDEMVFRIKLRRGWVDPITIQPYRGHGNAERLYLKGRVLENKGITSASQADSVWLNLLNMYRRFASDEIPHARLRVRFQEHEFEASADEEGYFDLQIEPRAPLPVERAWHEIELTLVAPLVEGQQELRTVGHVLVPPPQSDFGVISDIDDTIVHTGATDPLTMARVVVLNNPHTRLPFEGVAAFYQALRKGSRGGGYNPIFYVSSSPWNLYDLLIDFLNIHGIPLGPLFLRDIGLDDDKFIKSSHHEHKLKQIRTILNAHTALPFVLIGDSGQEDPEIYRQIVAEYPGRIRTIYIRDVSLDERDLVVDRISAEIRSSGVELVRVADTVAAAEHAIQHGLICAEALPDVRADKINDEQQPTLLEQLPGMPGPADTAGDGQKRD